MNGNNCICVCVCVCVCCAFLRGVKKELLMRELDDFPFESERRNGYG